MDSEPVEVSRAKAAVAEAAEAEEAADPTAGCCIFEERPEIQEKYEAQVWAVRSLKKLLLNVVLQQIAKNHKICVITGIEIYPSNLTERPGYLEFHELTQGLPFQ